MAYNASTDNMKITHTLAEETTDILVDRYQISTQFINKLLKEYNLESCEKLIGRLTPKEKLCLIISNRGVELFSGKSEAIVELRAHIICRWDSDDIDSMFDRHYTGAGNVSQLKRKAKALADKSWHNGKRWATDFAITSGFDKLFSGIRLNDTAKKDAVEIIEPRIPLPFLKDFQLELKQRIIDNLKQKGDDAKCMISLPTGGGKTRTAVEAYIDWLKPRFSEGKYLIWIAQSEELCEQAIASIKQVWSATEYSEPLRVYRFFRSYELESEDMLGGAVICGINKLYNAVERDSDEVRRLFEDCGAMIIDEAHRSTTMMYKTLYEYAKSIRGEAIFPICGLTATPSRSCNPDDLTSLYNLQLFYPTLGEEYNNDPLRYFRDRGFLAIPNFKPVKTGVKVDIKDKNITIDSVNLKQQLEDYSNKTICKVLAKDESRNRKIISELERCKDTPTLVYACNIEHAKLLSAVMNHKGYHSVVISAETHAVLRYKFIDQFKKGEINFIFNHSVLTTGFDAPKTENIVICRPIFSDILYEQIVGRGLRGKEFGGTESCNIIDFSDTYSRFGDQLSYARYKEQWGK